MPPRVAAEAEHLATVLSSRCQEGRLEIQLPKSKDECKLSSYTVTTIFAKLNGGHNGLMSFVEEKPFSSFAFT
jgi:hypothetical protein